MGSEKDTRGRSLSLVLGGETEVQSGKRKGLQLGKFRERPRTHSSCIPVSFVPQTHMAVPLNASVALSHCSWKVLWDLHRALSAHAPLLEPHLTEVCSFSG